MLSRILKYSARNILRNKFLSISSILVLTLLMFFINILLVMHDVSFKIINSINSRLNISLYLKEEYDENSVDYITLKENIEKVNSNINVLYKNKELILKELGDRMPDLVKIIERTNPLPNTINISNINLNDYEKVNEVIENKSFILSTYEGDEEYFSNYKVQYNNIERLISTLNNIGLGLYIVIAIFLVSIGIIIYSIIGNFIYYYKDEIYITRLVGGSKLFIFGPFVSQGIIYSITSFILSILIFLVIIDNVSILIGNDYEYAFSLNLFLIKLLISVFIGGASGYFSSRKYLK